MTAAAPLCRLEDIPDPGARSFVVEVEGRRQSVFVVRRGAQVWGYVNSCPHVAVPLDWETDRFLDITQQVILCGTHGARFEIETGFCLWGPCRGKALSAYPVTLLNGVVTPAPPSLDI